MAGITGAAFRLSAQQERLWTQVGDDAETLRVRCEVQLSGPFDSARLQNAIKSIVRSHEILRTGFQRQSGMKLPFQVIGEESSLTWNLSDNGLLLLELPAACADRRSMENLVAAIGREYAGESESSEVLQYADVVEWQNELLTGDESKAGRDYWRDQLAKMETPNPLASFETTGGSFTPVTVTRETAATVPAEIALAAWQIFLSRMSGQPRIPVACEFDGRNHAELEDAIGMFGKALPIQVEIDGDTSFRTLTGRVKNALSDAQNWQESFNPAQWGALPIGFDYVSTAPTREYGGAGFEILRVTGITEPFTLRLSICGNRLEFQFDSSKLGRETVERWAGHYQVLLHAALENPETPAGSLPLLDKAELRQIREEWNQTAADYPRDRCFHQLFEEQVKCTPDSPAVRSGEAVLTYRELNARANRLAHRLRGMGVQPDGLIGLCVDRGVDMIAGLLGIMKSGAAFVPVNADNPGPRLARQLASAFALVTEDKFAGIAPEFTGPRVLLGEVFESNEADSNPAPTAGPDNLIYVIYTSGSTGVPKGAAIRHRNLVNYAWFIRRRLDGEGLHFATVSTLSADLGNTCIYPSLISGGCLHVIPHDTAADSRSFAAYQRQYPIDVLKIVPSHLSALLEGDEGRGVLPRSHLITGGEQLTRSLIDRVRELGPNCEFWNHYGPTETTVGSLMCRLKDHPGPVIPIGRPIANTQVWIVDSRQQSVPVGVAGEVIIGGDGVTAGYIGQPELTAERFAGGNYHTGDLARFGTDGSVEFLGRRDDQVKIRGYRIELGEIEAVLSSHADVRRALVIARPDERGDKRLIAYVTGPREHDPESLKTYLKERLPEYMVPPAIVILAKFPLTANGKIDRQNLPEPEKAKDLAYVAPRTETEKAIAAVWAGIFRRERIGVTDNFFDIGGHSLLATQVISRLRSALGIDPPLKVLFESPTIAQLAEWVDNQKSSDAAPERPPLTPVARNRDLPLSYAQQRIWVIDRLEPAGALYNIPRAVRLRGALDVPALHAALNEIARRHESLRTTFGVSHGEPVQIIAAQFELPLTVEDLSQLPIEEREPAARASARAEAIAPFDLSTGPLVRARLLRLAENDHVFLFTSHHIVSDGWSAGVFFSELAALYEAFAAGKPSPLPEMTVQYADYAVWQREWFQGDALQKQLTYWREQLQGAPALLSLPFDRPRSASASFAGAAEVIAFPAELSRALHALAREEDATLFMVLLAGFQTLLMRYSGEDQIVLGTDVANRTTSEAERMIGFFINLLPLRGDLSGNPTFRELLGRVRKNALGAYAHQDLPFDKLVEELQPERKAGQNPIVQALFVMQNTPQVRRSFAGLETGSFSQPVRYSKFDLAVFMSEKSDHLEGHWVFRTDLFDAATIRRIGRQFQALLQSATSNPDARLSALEILTSEEKERRIEERNQRKTSQRSALRSAQPKAAGPVSELATEE